MKGFVLGHGRSGTGWVAYALRQCTDLDARHEAMGYFLGQSFGGVEVNSRLWDRADAIHMQFPTARVAHLVRDGRDVVRSVLERKPERTLGQACQTWAARNEAIAKDVPASNRWRFEDLTTSLGAFAMLAMHLQSGIVDEAKWERCRATTINQADTDRVPPFEGWCRMDQQMFWHICGRTMRRMGYER